MLVTNYSIAAGRSTGFFPESTQRFCAIACHNFSASNPNCEVSTTTVLPRFVITP